MFLDERKTKILQLLIRSYLETGEPVGSRTIAKLTDIGLSAATIRNEMSDLESMGFLLAPHASAGRIPSDKGYRLYVDSLMEEKEREIDELKDVLSARQDKLENQLKRIAKLLANATECATMVSAPRYAAHRLKFTQLSRVSPQTFLATVVLVGNLVKNSVMDVEREICDADLLKLNLLLNSHLNGVAIEEINLGLMAGLRQQAGEFEDLIGMVLNLITECVKAEEDLEVYTSGANNIFKYPELSVSANAAELINTFEEKALLSTFVSERMNSDNESGIQVYIGSENGIESMRDCSVITASYELDDGAKSTIGIVGPKRMDYEKVVGILKGLKKQIGNVYSKDT